MILTTLQNCSPFVTKLFVPFLAYPRKLQIEIKKEEISMTIEAVIFIVLGVGLLLGLTTEN